MARGDAPKDMDDFEVKIDWVVCDGLKNGLDVDEMKETLDEYSDRLEDDDFVEKFSES